MSWDDVSDFNINKAIAISLGHQCYYGNGSFTNGLSGDAVVVKGNKVLGCVDYCNSWSDIGPLLICITEDLFSKPEWCLLNRNLWEYWIDVCNGNMCHAASIVYLESKSIRPEDCK